MNMNNKKTIIILILVLTIGIIGLTVAYFSNSTTLNNIFETKPYGDVFTEEFVAPTNWLPGDTTNKSVVATNTGEVDQAVRVKLTESWKTANNGTLNGWIHTDGTKSTHETENDIANDERVAIINFDNDSDWTKVGDYYYYNYKLAPNESTSSLIKSVTFNSKTKLDDTCESSTNGSTKTVTCNSSGDDYDHATYKLKIDIETVQYNKYQEAWNTNVAIASEKPSSGVDTLLSNEINADGAAYNTQTKSKMFKMTHPATAQTPAQTEYRYIGDNPNNYVYFNCDSLDNQTDSTCEVWRIIGVFDVDDGTGNYEQRIKIVRGSDLATEMKWNNGSNISDWTDTNASLKMFLNGDYYNRSGSAEIYGLKVSARNIIEEAKYYLGAFEWKESNTTEYIYSLERGTTPCYYCNNDVTKTTWTGVVGLMYPSDMYMTYAKTEGVGCYNQPMSYSVCGATNGAKSWIYNTNKLEGNSSYQWTWLLSPCSPYDNAFIADNGVLEYSTVDSNSGGVRPVAYLKSDIKITEGTGESTNPFKLGM